MGNDVPNSLNFDSLKFDSEENRNIGKLDG